MEIYVTHGGEHLNPPRDATLIHGFLFLENRVDNEKRRPDDEERLDAKVEED